jgi:uncharacterized membrane protein YqjE
VETAHEGPAGASPPAGQRPSFRSLGNELASAFGARAHLLELEAKQAAWSAAYMIGFAVAAALLAVTAWLILIGGLMALAVRLGMPWWLTVILAIALQAGAAWLLVTRLRGLADNLTFAATRRSLSSRSTGGQHGSVAQ